MYTFEEGFRPGRWPRPVKAALGVFVLGYLYVFGVKQGDSFFHDINHFLSILVLAHVIIVASQGWSDDLVSGRRKSRVLVVLVASSYGILLAAVELLDLNIKGRSIFGIANSVSLLLLVPLFAWFVPRGNDAAATPRLKDSEALREEWAPSKEDQIVWDKLERFVLAGGYLESGLTVKSFAEQLACPEYRLRRLINTQLGFNNFSQFLNHHRLKEARCRLLEQPKLPILTLALDLGYGSIGPFNRAFKATFGCTPTEYRRNFQNQP
ncbi:AraC family transcriptional regulator [Marinimicrobium locisalis]|uniref:AraC family transcriptional regulator n=1 Tax=Marinimicrobium locisalis TaxID=546022 RepID=UPI0032218D14